jgi:hypothetical protein
MKKEFLFLFCFFSFLIAKGQQNYPFPLIDLHVHLKGDLTVNEAVVKSKNDNIKYGIAVNCGLGFPIHNDSQIDSVIAELRNYPQFYIGMQGEGREWVKLFSKASRKKFDYVFTDAMTFTDEKGRRNRIWIKEETWIDNEEQFMDYYVNTIVKILSTEPIDIYVNPTYLPETMSDRYDIFWTTERMDKVINAAKRNKVAIEINNRYKIPSARFILRAKKAGVKFTNGTNNIDKNFGRSEYLLEMIRICGLDRNYFFMPVKKK